MAAPGRSPAGGTSFVCRCGATFCSEASFVAAWHGGHKAACPHASQLMNEVAEASAAPSPTRRTQTALLCSLALSRQKLVAPEAGLASRDAGSVTSSTTAASSPKVSCAASTASTASTASRASCDVSSRLDRGSFSFSDFAAVAEIGSGAFGTVQKVVHARTCDVFAMKSIAKRLVVDKNMAQQLLREVKTQLLVEHPHIIRLFHYFEDADNIHLLLEHAGGGSLFRHLQQRHTLPELEASRIFLGIASALDHLHQRGTVHRDVKPENVLLCEGNVAKLADFGWCAELAAKRQTFCGTWDYLSPEMINGDDHDHRVDVWAMGVLLYEMLVGCPPFTGHNNAASLRRIQEVDLQLPGGLSSAARDLIQQLLRKDPSGRISLREAQRHVWVLPGQEEPPPRLSFLSKPEILSRPFLPKQEETAVETPPPRRQEESSSLDSTSGMQWPWKEKLHRLELVEDDGEDLLISPISKRNRQHFPAWKDTEAYAAVQAFVKEEPPSSRPGSTPERPEKGSGATPCGTGLCRVEILGEEDLKRPSSSPQPIPRELLDKTMRLLAARDEVVTPCETANELAAKTRLADVVLCDLVL